MGFLGKLFSNKTDIDKLRSAIVLRNYAEAFHLAEDLLATGEESTELIGLQVAAADGLAQLNLDEGLRFLQAGNVPLGADHLQLALSQARSSELKAKIEKAISQQAVAESEVIVGDERSVPESAINGDSEVHLSPRIAEVDLPDQQSQLELVLASYPSDMQQRYLARSTAFLQAFLQLHEGEDRQSLILWQQLPEDERDGLYLFELGSLYGRLGKYTNGIGTLRQALDLEPGNLLVVDALLTLMLDQNELSAAIKLLNQQLDVGADPAFCYARRCELQLRNQDRVTAFESARKALGAGFTEPGFVALAASLYEQDGQLDEAEHLLTGLPGGGCGGGINLPLAEFWLRQNRELSRVLDAFNGACRQEPENLRWQLRAGQTYLARNWRKQGLKILRNLVGDPRLDEQLRLEAEQLLAEA